MNRAKLILVVEDNENDAALLGRASARAGLAAMVKRVKTAEEAMAYLEDDAPCRDRKQKPIPALMLLDVYLPGIGGFELLRWLRSQPDFQGIFVVVLTGSTSLHDVRRAYALGANCYLPKPLESGDLEALSVVVMGNPPIAFHQPYSVLSGQLQVLGKNTIGLPISH